MSHGRGRDKLGFAGKHGGESFLQRILTHGLHQIAADSLFRKRTQFGALARRQQCHDRNVRRCHVWKGAAFGGIDKNKIALGVERRVKVGNMQMIRAGGRKLQFERAVQEG